MKQLPLKSILSILLLLLYGCSQDEEVLQEASFAQPLAKADMAVGRSNLAGEVEPGPDDTQEFIKDARKIIKRGELVFECRDLRESRLRIDAVMMRYDAYVTREHESRYDDRIEQHIVIRVPSEYFERLLDEASHGVNKFDRKQIEAVDVTENYLDIEARLRIKKETESRYLALLDRANTVEEILAIERQIEALRSDIESIEGRLKYLQNQIGYSTLTVTLYEVVSLSENSFLMRFLTSIGGGLELLVASVLAVVAVWPFLLLLALLLLAGYLYYRRVRKPASPVDEAQTAGSLDDHTAK